MINSMINASMMTLFRIQDQTLALHIMIADHIIVVDSIPTPLLQLIYVAHVKDSIIFPITIELQLEKVVRENAEPLFKHSLYRHTNIAVIMIRLPKDVNFCKEQLKIWSINQ